MIDSQLSGQRRGTTIVNPGGRDLRPAEILRLHRLGRELRLTDQILSLDLDSLSIVEGGPAPAWTSLEGDHISFALDQMPFPTSRLDVAVWLGTNAHELGHSLFSPRRHSLLMRRVLEGEKLALPGVASLHNIVEDQRQERVLLGRFAPWKAYLTAALGHHISPDQNASWVLLAGRTWLPDTVRAKAKAAFVLSHGASAAEIVPEIIGAYQALTDPGEAESDQAWDLLIRLHDLFGPNNIPRPPHPCEPIGSGQPDISEPSDQAPPPADEAAPEPPSRSREDDDDAPPEGEGQDQDRGAGQGQAGGDGNQPASKPKPKKPGVAGELTDAAADQLAEDTETRDDVDSILDALSHGRAGDGATGGDSMGQYVPTTDAARRLHHEIGDALRDLKDNCEPGWHKRVDSGRLNVRRLTNPLTDPEELFDRYEPGQMESAELELVLLLDVSSSMASKMWPMAEATWAIRHAADDIEATVTVFTFDSGPHGVMAFPGQRPDDRMFLPADLGGTNPASALSEALRLTIDSPARNRLIVILTDGAWNASKQSNEIITLANESGIVTVLAQLGKFGQGAHDCQHYAVIDDLAELARLFQRVAIAQMEMR